MTDALSQGAQGIDVGGVEPVTSLVPRMAKRRRVGVGAPADPVLRFEDDVRDIQPRKREPGTDAGRSRTDDDDIRIGWQGHGVI